jgi:CTD small phosphatase-like protein 2
LINNIKPINPEIINVKKLILPKKPIYKDKKTIVFDLDETLIHCNESVNVPGDLILPIKFPSGEIIEVLDLLLKQTKKASINIRPHSKKILQFLSLYYEVIIFTASHSCYANVVIDYLDPKNEYVSHRLFREHCIQTEEGAYLKDLR